MDKKTVFALILIAVIILTLPYYQKLIQGDKPINPVIVKKDTVTAKEKDKVVTTKPVEQEVKKLRPVVDKAKTKSKKNPFSVHDSKEHIISIESDKIFVQISNRGGGGLKKFILKKYNKYDSTLVNMIDPEIGNNLHFSFMDRDGNYIETDTTLFFQSVSKEKVLLNKNDVFKIEYILPYKESEIKKTYIFYGDHYHVDIVVHFKSPDKVLLNRQYQFGWKNGLPSSESYVTDDNNYNQAYVYMGDELESYDVTEEGKKETATFTGKADWIGVRTKYFLGSISNINANVSDGVYISGRGIKRKDYVQRLYDVGYNVRYSGGQTSDSLRL